MGIDGIGKKPPIPPPATPPGGASPMREAGRPFELSRPAATTQAAGVEPLAATPLDRLRAGEIDVNGYVELKVNEATAHLAALPPSELEAVRSALRDRLASDPTLVDLVRTATGAVPRPPDE
jgi:hypothetical protein